MSQCWKMQIIADKVTESELQHCLEMLGIEVYQTHQHAQNGNAVADGMVSLSSSISTKDTFKAISEELQKIHKECRISTKWDKIGDDTVVHKTSKAELWSAKDSMPIRVVAVIEGGVLTDVFATKGAKIQMELLDLDNMKECDDGDHAEEMAIYKRLDYETDHPDKHDLEAIL